MGKYFTLQEMCASSTAKQKGINNEPPLDVKDKLEELIKHILDPLREAYGKPIRVNSGFRSPELNKAIGGVTNSQHVLGQAADITGGSKEENKKLFDLIQKLELPFDQVIDESNFSWVHVSYGPRNRKQILKL